MEFFGSLERFFAELYPHRWPILILVFLLLTGAAALGYWRGWHLVLWRHRVGLAIIGSPGLAAAVAIGLWLGLPLFTSTTVNEEFPFAQSAVVPPGMTMASVEMVMDGMAKVDQPVSEPMPDSMSTTMPKAGVEEDAGATPEAMVEGNVADTGASEPAGPIVLKSGSFRDADSFHRGSGQATIYQTPDGGHLLRFENFETTNGPDLHVLLSQSPNPQSTEDVKSPGYLDLGKIKGNIGNQNYPIPSGTDVGAQMSVVIYCKPFSVVFSVAPLTDA